MNECWAEMLLLDAPPLPLSPPPAPPDPPPLPAALLPPPAPPVGELPDAGPSPEPLGGGVISLERRTRVLEVALASLANVEPFGGDGVLFWALKGSLDSVETEFVPEGDIPVGNALTSLFSETI